MDNNNQTKDNQLTTSDVSLIVASTASAIAVVVYSLKHVKNSSCFGGFFKCSQVVVVDEPESCKVVTEL